MKKLTAFIAVVALGLLSSLTANAQINIAYSNASNTTTPAGANASHGIVQSDINLSTSGNQNFTGINPVIFDLGTISFSTGASPSTGSYTVTSTYDITVTAGAFSQTKSFAINYNIVLSNLTASTILFNASDLTTGTFYAPTFDFVFGANAYHIAILDNSVSKTENKTLFFQSSKASVGNLELDAFVTANPVPEPSTYALMGASGLAALVGFRRFRSKKANKA